MDRIGRNDPCHCNSGKKYKKCCRALDEGRQARTDGARSSHSLRDKNIALLGGMFEIFGLDRHWLKVKDDITDRQISEFYQYIAELWPINTDLLQLLPKPDSSLRALYLGENEPELMLRNVFRFCLYADQIVIVNPFDNPNVVAEKFNPILHPGEWRLQTIRMVFHLMLLTPWIDAGLVILIPDPGDFDRQLRVGTWNLALKRLDGWEPSSQDLEQAQLKERTQRMFLMAPNDYLEQITKETNPGISDEEVRRLMEYIEHERANDPLLLNSTLDQIPGQMTTSRLGGNLEMGLYICRALGAFPYTNVKFRWNEILNARDRLDETAQIWSPLTKAFQELKFRFLDKVDSDFACSVRKDGRLENFRAYLRRIWRTFDASSETTGSEAVARDFGDELSHAYSEAQAEWNAIDRDLMKWVIPKLGGAALVGGHFSPAFAAGGFAAAGVSEIIQAQMKRHEFRKRVPMSVFIDLERR